MKKLLAVVLFSISIVAFADGVSPAIQAVSSTQLPASLSAGGNLKLDLEETHVTQPVSGSVSVSNLPATQTVSGTVSVSNLPATQPVSAAALPLPSGAATSAKQPALGIAGTPSADVLTIQGATGMTALKVDGSGVTQPVSGSMSISNFPATQSVSGSLGRTWSLLNTTDSVNVGNFPSSFNIGNFPLDLSGFLKVHEQGTANVSVTNASIPVTGTFWQATQPVSGSMGRTWSLLNTTDSVNVGNFPASQVVSGSVSVSNFPATQSVSGSLGRTWSLLNTTDSVNVGNFPASQNVNLFDGAGNSLSSTTGALNVNVVAGGGSSSVASVGANGVAAPTSSDQIGGVDSLGKLQPASIVSGALKVDGSAVTQPVSGSVSVSNLPASQTVNGSVSVSNFPATQNVNVTNASLPIEGGNLTAVKIDGSAVTQPVSGTVTANAGTGTFAVSAASLPLPSGASTAANQATGNATLSAISGQIPATLDVSGNLKVHEQGTATVSGTVTANVQGGNATAVKVDGSAVTQPVSAAALPLPSGAATSAKQPALGIAGTPSSDVITIQGAAGMTALKVDGSATTQPVSGSVSVSNFPASQNVNVTNASIPVEGGNLTAVKVDGSGVTQPISAAALPLPSGASTAANQATANSSLSTIATNTTGAATAANQTTGNSSLSSIDGKISTTLNGVKVDGSAVTQPVSVQNFPATQAVSGTVNIGNFPNTYAVAVDTYTTNGAQTGTIVDVHTSPVKWFSGEMVEVGTGASLTWNLDCSLDGVNFVNIFTGPLGSGTGLNISGAVPYPCLYFRSHVTALTLNTATSITTYIVGMN